MNNIVVDASAIIAVVVNEPSKSGIIQTTQNATLLAPASIHWEIANAFSAMFKCNRIKLEEALAAIDIYKQIPIRFIDVELEESLQLAHQLNIYAYDAYLLRCAQKHKAPLLSLDERLLNLAESVKLPVIEV
jgi:predicted nucleic acid-binding protein